MGKNWCSEKALAAALRFNAGGNLESFHDSRREIAKFDGCRTPHIKHEQFLVLLWVSQIKIGFDQRLVRHNGVIP